MIAGLKPYAVMKDSGVPWLGEVPAHWGAASVKRHYAIQLGKMLQTRPEGPTDVEAPYLKARDVQWFVVRPTSGQKMWASPRDIEQFGVNSRDLLVCEGGEGGRAGIVRDISPGHIIQNALHRVRPLADSQNEFLLFVMSAVSSTGWFDAINSKATIAHFTRDKFGALGIPLPPPHEQAAIVHFLGHADRRIRRYIRAKQKLIKLLEEQKQAIIHRAVTRGLDADVRLKLSGVEWLSDVPEHWDVKPAKYFFREVDERSESGAEELLSVSHITGVTPRSQKNITMFMAESNVGHKICRPGDLVINTMWAWMAALGVARQTGLVSPSYAVYRPWLTSRLSGDYADLLLRTTPYKIEYICRSTGIRLSRLRLYPEEFLRIRLLCPPVEEQRRILDFVGEETAQARRAIAAATDEIALLREYRTQLIADVVTGKLDVRAAAPRLPDEVAEFEPLDEAEAEADMEDDAVDDGDALEEAEA